MPIYKKHKVFSEKLTSIEDPIAVVQRGVISFAPSAGRTFLIPTKIENVVALNITAGNDQSGTALRGYSFDFQKHYATAAGASNAIAGFGALASLSNLSEVGIRLRMSRAYKLYVANASMASTTIASNSMLASRSLFTELEGFNDGGKNYLLVTIDNSASASWKTKKQKIGYEVIGYEY